MTVMTNLMRIAYTSVIDEVEVWHSPHCYCPECDQAIAGVKTND